MEITAVVGSLLGSIVAFLFWKIKQFEGKDFLTRNEIENILAKEVDRIDSDYQKLDAKMDEVARQLVQISVTLARIDERMKQDAV